MKPDTKAAAPEPDHGGCAKGLIGLVAGLLLSGAYIQWNWALPGWLQFPGLIQGLGPRTVADATLEDPQADHAAKQRAVEELFRHDPNLFRELDDSLDGAVTRAVIDRKARRRLMLLQSKQRTLRKTLGEDTPAIREAALRKHQVKTLDELLIRMGVEDLRGDPFFHHYLRERFPGMDDADLLGEALQLSPGDLFPPPPMP